MSLTTGQRRALEVLDRDDDRLGTMTSGTTSLTLDDAGAVLTAHVHAGSVAALERLGFAQLQEPRRLTSWPRFKITEAGRAELARLRAEDAEDDRRFYEYVAGASVSEQEGRR